MLRDRPPSTWHSFASFARSSARPRKETLDRLVWVHIKAQVQVAQTHLLHVGTVEEMTHLNSGMTAIRADREKMMEQFNVIKRSMDATTEETSKLHMSLAGQRCNIPSPRSAPI